MNWATFLATFSQSHLVTLASAHVSLQQKQKFVKYQFYCQELGTLL
jgi:hypothetical protein